MLAATYYQSPPPPAYGVNKPVQYYMESMPTSSLFYTCARCVRLCCFTEAIHLASFENLPISKKFTMLFFLRTGLAYSRHSRQCTMPSITRVTWPPRH